MIFSLAIYCDNYIFKKSVLSNLYQTMKLVTSVVLLFAWMFWFSTVMWAYSPTSFDLILVENFSKKISNIHQSDPMRIEKIAPKLKSVVMMYEDSSMEHFVLHSLYEHIISLINTIPVSLPVEEEIVQLSWPVEVENTVDETSNDLLFNLPDTASDWSKLIQKIINTWYIKWNPDAKFSLIEFSDFQCPFCQRFTLDKVIDTVIWDYEWKINTVFAHFPLSNHPLAEDASLAAECVWELWWWLAFQRYKHELFFLWFTDLNKAYEALNYINIDIDRDEFDTCWEEKRHLWKIESDYNAWVSVWVRWTPTVIFFNRENGNFKVIPWANTPEAYADIINQLEPDL